MPRIEKTASGKTVLRNNDGTLAGSLATGGPHAPVAPAPVAPAFATPDLDAEDAVTLLPDTAANPIGDAIADFAQAGLDRYGSAEAFADALRAATPAAPDAASDATPEQDGPRAPVQAKLEADIDAALDTLGDLWEDDNAQRVEYLIADWEEIKSKADDDGYPSVAAAWGVVIEAGESLMEASGNNADIDHDETDCPDSKGDWCECRWGFDLDTYRADAEEAVKDAYINDLAARGASREDAEVMAALLPVD